MPADATPPRLRATRRRFLQLMGGAGSTAALVRLAALTPAAGLAACSEAERAAGFFSAREREVLTQIVERIVASDDPALPAVRETRTIDTIDALCAGLDPAVTEPLRPLVLAFDWSPLVFDFTLTRFTHMAAADKDAALRAWMTSRFTLRRMAFAALRNLALVGYYSQDATWPAIGYAGPLLRDPGGPAGSETA